MRTLNFAVLFLLSACMTTPIPVEREELDTKVKEIIAWLAEHSDYPARPSPGVRFIATMPASAYKDQSRVDGVYVAETREVFLLTSWQHDDEQHVMLLAHELVHFLQDESGQEPLCYRDAEIEAYELGFAYAQEHFGGRWGWFPGGKEDILALPCE